MSAPAERADVAARLQRLDRLAAQLDSCFRIPWLGVRFGWDAIAGLVPVLGDLATALISFTLVLEARRLGAPWPLVARMVGHVLLDALIGAIPIIGTVFDVLYRANDANLALLIRHLGAEPSRVRSATI